MSFLVFRISQEKWSCRPVQFPKGNRTREGQRLWNSQSLFPRFSRKKRRKKGYRADFRLGWRRRDLQKVPSPHGLGSRRVFVVFRENFGNEIFARVSTEFSPPSRRLGGEATFRRFAKFRKSEISRSGFFALRKIRLPPEVLTTFVAETSSPFCFFFQLFSFLFLLTRFRREIRWFFAGSQSISAKIMVKMTKIDQKKVKMVFPRENPGLQDPNFRRNEAAPSGAAERPAQGGVGPQAEPPLRRLGRTSGPTPNRPGPALDFSPKVHEPVTCPEGADGVCLADMSPVRGARTGPVEVPAEGRACFRSVSRTGGPCLSDMILDLSLVREDPGPVRSDAVSTAALHPILGTAWSRATPPTGGFPIAEIGVFRPRFRPKPSPMSPRTKRCLDTLPVSDPPPRSL